MSTTTHHGAAVHGADRAARAVPRAAEAGRHRADALLGPLLPLLVPWLATRRRHQGTTMSTPRPVTATVIGGDSRPDLVVAVVETASGDRCPLLLGLRRDLPGRLEPAAIGTVPNGPWAGRHLYDGTADPALMGVLLRALAARRAGPLRLEAAGPHPLPVGLIPRPPADGGQGGAVVYGDRLRLRLYRDPRPGPHPEVELLRALTDRACPRTPRLYGSLHLDGLLLGVIEEHLPAAEDGWRQAVAHARDHILGTADTGRTGCFTSRAQALGQAVAELHDALGTAFPRQRMSPEETAADAARMKRRLAAATAAVPQLARHRSRLTALFDEYGGPAARGCPVLAQRVHGDLHLGRALYTGDGWRLVGLADEADPPAGPPRPQPVLRDVAGVLRSFDHAARAALLSVSAEVEAKTEAEAEADTGPGRQLSRLRRASAWALRNRRAFCAGYTAAGGEDPSCRTVQLTAFEADRALSEAVHEARHRPHGLPVPLAEVHRLAGRVR
ncbi:maltokinase N-terminal cap-like domain-containing protein [Streptomyces sp. NPDC001595]|uniref:maltokinase N-terminal cap-like domain-containing protein n=1 Tax=Streptomyces sp. NPDC001532 TaxID=3154520 RepID=UPI0033213A1B